jgi:hypothetical protein
MEIFFRQLILSSIQKITISQNNDETEAHEQDATKLTNKSENLTVNNYE